MATVSIVLPTHNRAAYLSQAVDSIRRQTHTDWELVVVNDASTDETSDLVESLARSDPRICALHNPYNVGVVRSLNKGFERTSGDYYTWTSDDNLYKPHAIDVLLKMIGNAGLVYSGMSLIDDVGQTIGHVRAVSPDQVLLSNFLRGCFLYTQELKNKVGDYNPEWEVVEDWDFWIRAIRAGFELRAVPDILYEYRFHDGSLAQAMRHELDDKIENLMKHHSRSLPEPHHSACLLHMARIEWQKGNGKEGRKLAKGALHKPGMKLYRGALVDGLFGPGTSKKWKRDSTWP